MKTHVFPPFFLLFLPPLVALFLRLGFLWHEKPGLARFFCQYSVSNAVRKVEQRHRKHDTSRAASERVPYVDFPLSRPRFEIIAPARFGLVCFRLKATDAANEELR